MILRVIISISMGVTFGNKASFVALKKSIMMVLQSETVVFPEGSGTNS